MVFPILSTQQQIRYCKQLFRADNKNTSWLCPNCIKVRTRILFVSE